MDQNQTIDNDLQKAIDDITKNTNTDPVFADPVAAPSSIPEGDTGDLGDPVGPFADSVDIPAPEPSPVTTSFDTAMPPMPDYTAEVPAPAVAPVAVPPVPPAVDAFQPAPVPAPSQAVSEPTPTAPVEPESVAPAPLGEPLSTPNGVGAPASENLNMRQVKEAALRDLVPLLGRLNMSPSQRFSICRNIFEDLKDYSVLEQAYRAASEITDETERAEALLYLVEAIDKI